MSWYEISNEARQYADDCEAYAAMVLSALAEKESPTFYAYLFAQYAADIRETFDLEGIRFDCANDDFRSDADDTGRCYLGTVFSIMPSGKFYTPWANSNVDDSEAFRDAVYTDALESVFAEYDMYIENGEGDPCDLYAVMDTAE